MSARLASIEETNRAQGVALAIHAAKLGVLEGAVAQTTGRQAALDAANARHTAKFTSVDASVERQAGRQGALEAIVAGRIRVAETSIAQSSVRLNALEAREARIPAAGVLRAVQGACSQIWFRLGGVTYIGSGWFYYDQLEDLKSGFFVTAAHCVVSTDAGTVETMSSAFIQDPTTGAWAAVDVRGVVYDGAADIALIRTGIEVSLTTALRLAATEPAAGDTCYVVGNPGGLDDDSVSVGCVRDAHYTEPSGHQPTDSILVTCPGMGGNSGGPIVDSRGDVIGIYTFGLGSEALGGGSNVATIRRSLAVLRTMRHYRQKRYLGLGWHVPGPYTIAAYYEPGARFRPCVRVRHIAADSPFAGTLAVGDLLESARLPSGEFVEFGNTNGQRTPGVLMSYDAPVEVDFTYVRPSRERVTSTVSLDRSYDDVPAASDAPLGSGLASTAPGSALCRPLRPAPSEPP
jgi:S1-C subfamily serine protease